MIPSPDIKELLAEREARAERFRRRGEVVPTQLLQAIEKLRERLAKLGGKG